MESLTIRKLHPSVKERLRLRAAAEGHSMEEEARRILAQAVAPVAPVSAFEALRRHLPPSGGVELDIPARHPSRELPGVE